MRKLDVVLKGWYGQKNFGDDLLLQVLYNELENNELFNIFLWCKKRKYLKKIAPKAAIFEPWTYFSHPVVLILGGGTQFFSYLGEKNWYTTEKFLSLLSHPGKLARSPITLSKLLCQKVKDASLSRKVIWRGAIGIGVGPFREQGPISEKKLSVLRSMDWISVRDKESLELCKENNILKATVGADIAFLHPKIGSTKKNSDGADIVFIPRVSKMDKDWSIWETTFLRAFPKQRSDTISIVSLCETDHNMASILAHHIDASLTCWDPDVMTLESIIEQLASAKLVVSARYHGGLVSAASGVPTVLLGIDQKLFSLGHQLPNILVCHSPNELGEFLKIRKHLPNQISAEQTKNALASLRRNARPSFDLLHKELNKLAQTDINSNV